VWPLLTSAKTVTGEAVVVEQARNTQRGEPCQQLGRPNGARVRAERVENRGPEHDQSAREIRPAACGQPPASALPEENHSSPGRFRVLLEPALDPVDEFAGALDVESDVRTGGPISPGS
jgi:hypothetical protein